MYITISPGQWDGLHKAAYDAGHTLLEIEEVDGQEKAVRAYRRHNVGGQARESDERCSAPTGSTPKGTNV